LVILLRCCRQLRFRKSLPGAGEGIRTPDPLITNQMLYQLSYASKSDSSARKGAKGPSDPYYASGTII
jgi:hypothetical protein